eukprot:gene8352-17208_t
MINGCVEGNKTAVLSASKILWLGDSLSSIRILFRFSIFVDSFRAFIREQGCEEDIDFVCRVNSLESIAVEERIPTAISLREWVVNQNIMRMNLADVSIPFTSERWINYDDIEDTINILKAESESTLRLLAMFNFIQYITHPPNNSILLQILENNPYNVIFPPNIMWLHHAYDTMQCVLRDEIGKDVFLQYTQSTSIVYRAYFEFCCRYIDIIDAKESEQKQMIETLLSTRGNHIFFKCIPSSNDIDFDNFTTDDIIEYCNSVEISNIFKVTISMVSTETFPGFMNSKYAHYLVMKIREREQQQQQQGHNGNGDGDGNSNGNNSSNDERDGEKKQSQGLKTVAYGLDLMSSSASETIWLDMFRAMSESVSSSNGNGSSGSMIGMVVTDMTVPGLPLIHINEGFRAVTGYGKEKIGSNCRFLQGPETQTYLIEEIDIAMKEGQKLLFKIHYYKRNNQKFQCLLALHPVFGPAPEYEYKYQIGILIEFGMFDSVTNLLNKMECLLNLIPSFTTTGENEIDSNINNSCSNNRSYRGKISLTGDLILYPKLDLKHYRSKKTSPSTSTSLNDPIYIEDYKYSIVSFTKLIWIRNLFKSCYNLLQDEKSRKIFILYAKYNCNDVINTHLEFIDKALSILQKNGDERLRLLKQLHSVHGSNIMYNCTTTEIPLGHIQATDWRVVYDNLCSAMHKSAVLLARDAFTMLLESPCAVELIMGLVEREVNGEEISLKTVLYGLNLMSSTSETIWLDMFRAMSESVSSSNGNGGSSSMIGMVVTDMTVPGLPLVHINEGFRAVTGYGKEKIGSNCRFLQGPETQTYLIEEIDVATNDAISLITKVIYYKANGKKFQCLLALHPVFGPAPEYEYKYQISFMINFSINDAQLPPRISEMGKILRYMPQSMCAATTEEVDMKILQMETALDGVEEKHDETVDLESSSSSSSGRSLSIQPSSSVYSRDKGRGVNSLATTTHILRSQSMAVTVSPTDSNDSSNNNNNNNNSFSSISSTNMVDVVCTHIQYETTDATEIIIETIIEESDHLTDNDNDNDESMNQDTGTNMSNSMYVCGVRALLLPNTVENYENSFEIMNANIISDQLTQDNIESDSYYSHCNHNDKISATATTNSSSSNDYVLDHVIYFKGSDNTSSSSALFPVAPASPPPSPSPGNVPRRSRSFTYDANNVLIVDASGPSPSPSPLLIAKAFNVNDEKETVEVVEEERNCTSTVPSRLGSRSG